MTDVVTRPKRAGRFTRFDTPGELDDKLTDYLRMCYQGRAVVQDGVTTYVHDASTVPTLTGAAWFCGFAGGRSLHTNAERGEEWREVLASFKEAMENWYVCFGVRPRKGDNPIFMSFILQAQFGWVPAHKTINAGDPNAPVTIDHRTTPEDVERVIEGLDLKKPKKRG